jgi:hypothetical protein
MPVHKRIGATGPTAGLRRAHVEDAAGAAELLAILGYRAPLAQIEERIARRTKSPDADEALACFQTRSRIRKYWTSSNQR